MHIIHVYQTEYESLYHCRLFVLNDLLAVKLTQKWITRHTMLKLFILLAYVQMCTKGWLLVNDLSLYFVCNVSFLCLNLLFCCNRCKYTPLSESFPFETRSPLGHPTLVHMSRQLEWLKQCYKILRFFTKLPVTRIILF